MIINPYGHYNLGKSNLETSTNLVIEILKLYLNGYTNLSATLDQNQEFSYIDHTENPNSIFFYTSGTTGSPKLVKKENIQSLLINKKGKGSESDKWILTYHPYRWSGISLLLHVIRNNSKLVIPRDLDPDSIIEGSRLSTHISLTPSLFRKIVLFNREEFSKCGFSQITFGGETASQSTLNLAAELFPKSRITHVYANSEYGDVCSASDQLEGYPFKNFEKFWVGGNQCSIFGDVWEKRNDRVIFIGRENEIVNVGGDKVSLSIVKSELLKISGVHLAKVKSETSPILGNIITAEYVGDIEPREVLASIRKTLPKYYLSSVYKVDTINLSPAGKT